MREVRRAVQIGLWNQLAGLLIPADLKDRKWLKALYGEPGYLPVNKGRVAQQRSLAPRCITCICIFAMQSVPAKKLYKRQ